MIAAEVAEEVARAEKNHGRFNSTHEALGVLVEELWEVTEAIHGNDLEAVRAEAIQVAAVASRLAEQCRGVPEFAARSGCAPMSR